ncbi:MAG: DUF2442 domain-containing protein [Bacteroidota bacterium]
MLPKVRNVEANEDYTLNLEFTDDSHKIFDVKPYLEIGDFVELKVIDVFKTAKIFMGTVQWDNELDFSPETLYLEAKEIVV